MVTVLAKVVLAAAIATAFAAAIVELAWSESAFPALAPVRLC